MGKQTPEERHRKKRQDRREMAERVSTEARERRDRYRRNGYRDVDAEAQEVAAGEATQRTVRVMTEAVGTWDTGWHPLTAGAETQEQATDSMTAFAEDAEEASGGRTDTDIRIEREPGDEGR